MLKSKNVTLRRSSDAPLRRIRDTYGSEDGAETQLEQAVLAGEGRVKGHAPPLTKSEETQYAWDALQMLLTHLSAYGALGKMGGADPCFCQRLQPLLTRLMKCIVNGGFEVMESGEGKEDSFDVEGLLQAASKAQANCSEGVMCRCADTTIEIQLDTAVENAVCDRNDEIGDAAPPSSFNKGAPNDAAVLRVSFGFADYTNGETGAMLWAGAVGLSLYLVERYASILVKKACDVRANTGQPLRVIELGCGPALVSLVVAAMATRETATEVSFLLDVTDVSAAVVEEARRSFQSRNGPLVSGMLVVSGDDDNSGIAHSVNDTNKTITKSYSGFRVRPFVLDFGAIPHELYGVYDLVLASDVVYDHAIAVHVAPALEALLKPGGVAFLCCEAHRDGMSYFTQHICSGHLKAPHLRVTEEVKDVQERLSRLEMLSSLTSSTCSLIRIEKVVV